MLEEESGVGDIEGSSLGFCQWGIERAPEAEINQIFLASFSSELEGLLELIRVFLDAHDTSCRSISPNLSRDGAGELSQSAAEVDDPLASLKAEGGQ
jgi:hypothetical protein